MIDRLLSFLKDLPGSHAGAVRDNSDDPRIAAAALMVHLMDADGERREAEVQTLKSAMAAHFGVEGDELEALFRAGEEADRDAVDLYSFTSVLKRHLDEDKRAEFIAVMWEVVYADGELHELEDNLIWRVAELIGVDRRERIASRQRAAQDADGTAKGN